MVKVFEYVGRAQGVGGRLMGFPWWGRSLIVMAALPGLILLGLSILAFSVSLLALLLLTGPVYRLVRALSPGPAIVPQEQTAAAQDDVTPRYASYLGIVFGHFGSGVGRRDGEWQRENGVDRILDPVDREQ